MYRTILFLAFLFSFLFHSAIAEEPSAQKPQEHVDFAEAMEDPVFRDIDKYRQKHGILSKGGFNLPFNSLEPKTERESHSCPVLSVTDEEFEQEALEIRKSIRKLNRRIRQILDHLAFGTELPEPLKLAPLEEIQYLKTLRKEYRELLDDILR